MDPLNPLKSVVGRGDPLFRAEALHQIMGDGRFNEVPLRERASNASVARFKQSLRAEGYLDEDDRLTSDGKAQSAKMVIGTRNKLAQCLEDELGVPDGRAYAESMILDTGWCELDEIPDETVVIDGPNSSIKRLLREMHGEFDEPVSIVDQYEAEITTLEEVSDG